MINSHQMTAEEFAATKHELPDGGRWHELHEGRPVIMQAPDDHHGTTVLNLSRAMAAWFQENAEQKVGYGCHEIGLKVGSDPDTVYVPAISYFSTGQQFEETDNIIASQIPRLVVEVVSANDRRSDIRFRTLAYAAMGVHTIWVTDPVKKEVQVIRKGGHTLALADWQHLEGDDALPGFRIKISDMFLQPRWWTHPKR
ncbi:MAG: Uma2 family endonuclease [Fuerstiella sp.]